MKNLKPIYRYSNHAHLGYAMFYDQIVNDSKEFTKKELYAIINDKSIDVLIRQTALYMIGTQWTEHALEEIYQILNNYPELAKYIESLFESFTLERTIEYAKKLLNKNIISFVQWEIINSSVQANIDINFNPIKKFGQSAYE